MRLLLLFLFHVGVAGCLAAADPTGTTRLHHACYRDEAEEVSNLLKEGADPNVANRYGETPLALACVNGSREIVSALLKAGADPNQARPGGVSPLHLAARTGRPEVVSLILEAGAKVDAVERANQTALMWAAAEGHADVVGLLLDAGAERDVTLKSGFTPLLFAARNGQTTVVEKLIFEGADIHAATEAGRPGGRSPRWGTTPLAIAVENGHFETAIALLEAGADPNDQRCGFAPLHILTWVRKPPRGDGYDGLPPPQDSGPLTSLEFAKRLVRDYGADVNLILEKGNKGGSKFGFRGATPFLLAARVADLSYLKVLEELGADGDIANDDGTTPMLAVVGVGSRTPEEEAGTETEALAVAKWLRERGASVKVVNENGETAMHGAAYRNWPKMVDWLVEEGIEIETWNQENRHRWTPLLIAQGFRPGNFKPSAATVEAIKKAMREAGVEIPPDPPLPTTEKPKKYEP